MTAVHRGISLEEWEAKTQLSENELQSVYELQDACAELPLPSNWVSAWNQTDNFWSTPINERVLVFIVTSYTSFIRWTYTRLVTRQWNYTIDAFERGCTVKSLIDLINQTTIEHQFAYWNNYSRLRSTNTISTGTGCRETDWNATTVFWLVCSNGIRDGKGSRRYLSVSSISLQLTRWSINPSCQQLPWCCVSVSTIVWWFLEGFGGDIDTVWWFGKWIWICWDAYSISSISMREALEWTGIFLHGRDKLDVRLMVCCRNVLRDWQMHLQRDWPTLINWSRLPSYSIPLVKMCVSIQNLFPCFRNSMNVFNICSNTYVIIHCIQYQFTNWL